MQQSKYTTQQLKYLELLSQQFPTRQSVFTEIINLDTILKLPKGTEHFMSDIHGELEAFTHIMNNCSGVIRERVFVLFQDELDETELNDLCTLIYYPKEILDLLQENKVIDFEWYYDNLYRIIRLARYLSAQYTRSKVRKAMPVEYAYIIDELLRASGPGEVYRHEYHVQILKSIIDTGSADDFIISLSDLVKRLAVDHLHIVGDLYDRGAHADRIIDMLMKYHSLDIQWGNHDIMWMGAACGSLTCICSVIRCCVRYGAVDLLESGYGISLRNLAMFSQEYYQDNPEMSRMETAISVMLFKLEGQAIKRHPEFNQEDRLLLDKMDLDKGTVRIGTEDYELKTLDFPTVNMDDPYQLTHQEIEVLNGLVHAFSNSDRLKKHIQFLYDVGSMYTIRNNNLLTHGCIPLTAYGDFTQVNCEGKQRSGREYLDFCDQIARRAWHEKDQFALDWMYYLWGGVYSPLSGRVVKTFERTFVKDKSTWKEPEDPYYLLTESPTECKKILEEFGILGELGHIINGHTPVKAKNGESPIKADGKLLVIDGGFCKAYHKKTGIAGFTLIYTPLGMRIKAHKPFLGIQAAILDNADISSNDHVIETCSPGMKIKDTDTGSEIKEQIADLQALQEAYELGIIKEESHRY